MDKHSVIISIRDIRDLVYQYTSRRARIVSLESKVPNIEEELTLGGEYEEREDNVAPIDVPLKITSSILTVGSVKYNTNSLIFNIVDIRNKLIELTRVKASISGIATIAFSDNESTMQTISLVSDDLFNECCLLTSTKAKYIVRGKEGTNFDDYTMTEAEKELFTVFMQNAISGIKEYIGGTATCSIYNMDVYCSANKSEDVKRNIKMYLISCILSQYYRHILMFDIAKAYDEEMKMYKDGLNSLILMQKDSKNILNAIIRDGANAVYSILYPLCKNLPTQTFMMDNEIIFIIEKKEIPITGAALLNIYNMAESAIINGALSKWYTMCGIADDKNEAKDSFNSTLERISYFVEKKAKFVDVFSQLLRNGAEEVALKMLAYNKGECANGYIYDTERDEIGYLINKKGWNTEHNEEAINIMSTIESTIYSFLCSYVLKEWFMLCNDNQEYESNMSRYIVQLNKLDSLRWIINGSYSRNYKTLL